MQFFTTREDYLKEFKKVLTDSKRDVLQLEFYLDKQIERMDSLLSQVSKDNFFEILPVLLGIDSRLALLVEMIKYEDFSNDSIIEIIEKDYVSYVKELCGYDLKTKTKHSLIFNIV
ncbi:DUF7006 family protein [Enterococcus sp. DIV0840c]|uniref:DUF7006 family protein n=1 Tax=Enterococcus sp. DIV0840c TaxID=2774772 RepID=UPI003D2B4DAC